MLPQCHDLAGGWGVGPVHPASDGSAQGIDHGAACHLVRRGSVAHGPPGGLPLRSLAILFVVYRHLSSNVCSLPYGRANLGSNDPDFGRRSRPHSAGVRSCSFDLHSMLYVQSPRTAVIHKILWMTRLT